VAVKPLLLEGMVAAIDVSDDVSNSRRDIQRLEDENRSLRRDLEDALSDKERLERTVRNLQTTLGPIHRAMSILFGEMDLAVGEAPAGNQTAQPSAAVNGGDPRWQNYKNQFPGVPAEIIDALLIHGEMRITNLAGLLKRDVRTIYRSEDKLRKAGATTLNGGLLSLKR
jgi:hypothetical protein